MISLVGDRAAVVQFPGDWRTSDEPGARARALADALTRKPLPGQYAPIPSYASVTVVFDRPIGARELGAIRARIPKRVPCRRAAGKLVELPVRYDGPDLADVAALRGLSEAEVVRLHTEPTYLVHQLGFMPGFAYLGGLVPRLETPRLATPRARIPAGSVGIGGAQTGVYPLEGPGGWRIIGRTELRLFDPTRARNPSLLRAGMRVRFVAC